MRHALHIAALCLLACSETTPDPEAGVEDAGAPDAEADGGPQCAADEDCADEDPCTQERCEAERCVRERVDPAITVSLPIPIRGELGGLSLKGNRLIVARGAEGLAVWNLGGDTPRLEFERRAEGEEGPARGVIRHAERLYVFGESRGLLALDAESTAPVSLYPSVDEVRDLAFFDPFVVTATAAKGVEVVDYTDPASPTRRARLDTQGRATALARRGDLLLVGDGLAGLERVDLSTPTEPRRVGDALPTEGRVLDVSARGRVAVLAGGAVGVGVIDLVSFERLATLDLGAEALGVVMPERHTAVVAAGEAGLVLLDLLDPSEPTLWSVQDLGGRAHALSRDGTRYAVAVDGDHVLIVEVACE